MKHTADEAGLSSTCASRVFGCQRQRDRVGVILLQVGTPDEPTPKALRRYLKQFLGDRRIIEANPVLWWLVLNGIILNTRPRRSAANYKKIWMPEGSPLLVYSRRQQRKLVERLAAQKLEIPVSLGMRYGNPSVESALQELMDQGCRRIVALPLYPQYAGATSASACDSLFAELSKKRWMPSIRVVAPFYDHPAYRTSLVNTVSEYLSSVDRQPERILVSYHGIPQRYVRKGDPYCCMCTETTAFLKRGLSYPQDKVVQVFQSRFGREVWLQPYMLEAVDQIAKQGVKHMAVLSPAFVADCVETLEELGNEVREAFQHAGGERLDLIPCLNDRDDFIDCLSQLVQENGAGWLGEERCSYFCEACPSKIFV